MNQSVHNLAELAAVVTLCVIVLGAWVRLSHAGLGGVRNRSLSGYRIEQFVQKER